MFKRYLDVFRGDKIISEMMEEKNSHPFRIPINTRGFKGKTKRIYGHAYYPVTRTDNRGHVFKIFADAAYQLDRNGTYYRCRVVNNQIIPRSNV